MKFSVVLPTSLPGTITKLKVSFEKARCFCHSNNHDIFGGIMQEGIQRSANSSTITLTTYRNCHADANANKETIADGHPDLISN